MGLRINITDSFMDMAEAFKELGTKPIVSACTRAINRTLLTLRKESLALITARVKVKPKELRDRFIFLDKAGQGISSIEGSIGFTGESLHLLRFVKGKKTAIEQKGIPVKRRRKLKVEITPGKTVILRKAFIQKANSLQLFKRDKHNKLIRQAAPSIAFLVTDRGIGNELVASGQSRLAELLNRELDYQVMKAAQRANKGL